MKIYPPIGYKFADEEYDFNSEEEVRNLCLGMADDPDFKKSIGRENLQGLLAFLTENGFEIEDNDKIKP